MYFTHTLCSKSAALAMSKMAELDDSNMIYIQVSTYVFIK